MGVVLPPQNAKANAFRMLHALPYIYTTNIRFRKLAAITLDSDGVKIMPCQQAHEVDDVSTSTDSITGVAAGSLTQCDQVAAERTARHRSHCTSSVVEDGNGETTVLTFGCVWPGRCNAQNTVNGILCWRAAAVAPQSRQPPPSGKRAPSFKQAHGLKELCARLQRDLIPA